MRAFNTSIDETINKEKLPNIPSRDQIDQATEEGQKTDGRNSSCSVREEDILNSSIRFPMQLAMITNLNMLKDQQEKIMKISNYRDKKAHVNKIINSHRQEYGIPETQRNKLALCVTEIGGMLLEDMTMRSYADGRERITSIDAAQFSVSERKGSKLYDGMTDSKAFEGMAETMRFECMSTSGANSILQMAESTNEPVEIVLGE